MFIINYNMKKYYFLINSLEWGGAERVTLNLAKKYQKEGIKIYIITLKKDVFYDFPNWIQHIPLSNVKNNFLMSLLIPRYVIKFKKIIKKHNLSEWISLLEIANFVHILSKKNAIISFRAHISFFTWLIGYIYKLLIKRLYPKAWKIIVNSYENKYDLAEYLKIPEEKVEVLYNPIDTKKINQLKNEEVEKNILEKIENKKIFITTWRLVWQKHHEKILEALQIYNQKSNKNRIYLIVWDWPERKKLEKLTEKYGLSNKVVFLWQQTNVFKYLNVADVFLYASEVEGFPNVLLEAREIGVPIITSDFKSGAKEVIIWSYDKNTCKNIAYPYQGKYWIIVDYQNYKEQLLKFL